MQKLIKVRSETMTGCEQKLTLFVTTLSKNIVNVFRISEERDTKRRMSLTKKRDYVGFSPPFSPKKVAFISLFVSEL